MNRFTRNNLLLIVIIACSCVVAVLLLVFSVIRYIGMTQCMAEIEQISKEVQKLSKKNPSPHRDNRRPITVNTEIYKKVADELAVYFKPRLQYLAESFVRELEETNPQKEDGKVVPLTVEKFRSLYEEMWNRGQSYVDKQYNYNNFRELRFKNWTILVRKYLPKAQALTVEPLTEETLPEVLFSYIGIPRVMGEQPNNMVRYMKNYQNVLVNLMTSVKFNTVGNRVDWFGFDPDPTPTTIASKFTSPKDHYPQIARVWEIYGDVLKRMTSCSMKVSYTDKNGKKVTAPHTKELINNLTDNKVPYTCFDDKIDSFLGLYLRAAIPPANNSTSGNADALRNAISGTDDGSFRVYRLRIIVSATMDGIRTFIKALDSAYKDHHIYVVRSVALYAERDGAQEIFRSREEQATVGSDNTDESKKTVAAPQPAARGRGRGRGAAVEPAAATAPVINSKIDPAVLEELKKRQAEINKNLKFYERIGYGDVLIGDDKTSKAVIDFDCFELK